MNLKFHIKVIQQGQTQKVHVITPGMGMAGQAVVIKATHAARYQLTDIVTHNSPSKLQLKRVGGHLHMAMPDGDIEAPDVVIEDYFNVKNPSLWGSKATGEWMSYDTSGLTDVAISGSLDDASGLEKATQANLGNASAGMLGFVETPLGLGSLLGGGAAMAAAAGAAAGGGGGGEKGAVSTEALLKNYASATTNTAPKLSDYTSYGIKSFASLTDTSDDSRVALDSSNTPLTAINSAIAKLGSANITSAKVQAAVDSYYRILKEADGKADVDTDVYADTDHDAGNAIYEDPTADDYTNIGATVCKTTHALELLNDVVGRKDTSQVDTVDEINALARAAENVMLQAKAATSAASGGPALYTTDAEWATGLKQLGFTGTTSSMVGDIKKAIAATDDGGSGVNSYSALNDVINPIIAVHVLRNYSMSSGNALPSLQHYKDAGILALSSLSGSSRAEMDDATMLATLGTSGAAMSSATWQATLNSALDKLDLSSKASVADIKAAVQAMVDSYYRILKEADGVVNTTTNTDVYPGSVDDDPTANDYAHIGATVGGTLRSLVLLNDFVGLSAKAAVDTVDEINEVARAAENVMLLAQGATESASTGPKMYSKDAEWIAGLTKLGIVGVTTGNLAAVKKAIDDSTANAPGDANGSGSAVDTVEKLKALLAPVIKLQTLKDYITTQGVSAAPSLQDYTDLGVKTFKSLTDTLDANRKALNDDLTTGGAESNKFLTESVLNSALKKLDASSLDINKVQKMIDSYYRILREADGKYIGDSNDDGTYYNGSTTDKTANTDVYNDTTHDANRAAALNDPQLADYAAIGIKVDDAIGSTSYNSTTGIGNETLDLLNDAIGRMGKSAVDTAEEIDALATAANQVMLLASGQSAIQSDDKLANDKLVAGLNALMGLNVTTGVNSSNLDAFKKAIAGTEDSGEGVDTVDELLRLLSQTRIQSFISDSGDYFGSNLSNAKSTPTPTLKDWSLVGEGLQTNFDLTDGSRVDLSRSIFWNTTNNTNNAVYSLMALNSALDTYGPALTGANSTQMQTTMQGIVDSYGRILQAADGSRATETNVSKVVSASSTLRNDSVIEQDLVNVGVNHGGGNDSTTGTGLYYLHTGELLASSMGSLSSIEVDTVYELNQLAEHAANVMKLAAGNSPKSTDSDWINALNGLGIKGATSNNIQDIKTAIANTDDGGTGVDSWDELQAIVSGVRINDYAMLDTKENVPTLENYQSVAWSSGYTSAYTSVKELYLNFYNDAAKARTSACSVSELGDMVEAYTQLLASADGKAETPATTLLAADYNAIFGGGASAYKIDNILVGANTVQADTIAKTLSDVIGQLNLANIDTVSELSDLGKVMDKLFTMAAIDKSSGASNDDYKPGLSKSELGLLGLKISINAGTNPLASGSNLTDDEFRYFNNSVIYSANDGTGINSFDKLQALLTNAVISA